MVKWKKKLIIKLCSAVLTFQFGFPLSHLTPLYHPEQRCEKSHLFQFYPIKTAQAVFYANEY